MQQGWKKSKKRIFFNSTSVSLYVGAFLLIVALVAMGYQPPQQSSSYANSSEASSQLPSGERRDISVDDLAATTIAANIAQTANLPIANDVANLSRSIAIESILTETDENIVSKPQIVQPTASSREIKEYVVKVGDTVPKIAEQYDVSAKTIKWANDLTSDAVEEGKKLKILPVDGVLYTAKDGDTVDSIVEKYSANKAQFIAFNDLELGGLAKDKQLVIPSGDLPEEERPGYVAPTTNLIAPVTNFIAPASYSGGSTWRAAHAWSGERPDNGYPFGQCTWYSAVRRAQLGMPVGRQWGNGGSWWYSGTMAGRAVDGNPAPGAVMDGLGHVAIVESVVPGQYVNISEMNGYRGGGGWGRVGYITIEWSIATSGAFKYVH